MERNFIDFCERNFYTEWKKTESWVFIEEQVKKMLIDANMNSLGINIGY